MILRILGGIWTDISRSRGNAITEPSQARPRAWYPAKFFTQSIYLSYIQIKQFTLIVKYFCIVLLCTIIPYINCGFCVIGVNVSCTYVLIKVVQRNLLWIYTIYNLCTWFVVHVCYIPIRSDDVFNSIWSQFLFSTLLPESWQISMTFKPKFFMNFIKSTSNNFIYFWKKKQHSPFSYIFKCNISYQIFKTNNLKMAG